MSFYKSKQYFFLWLVREEKDGGEGGREGSRRGRGGTGTDRERDEEVKGEEEKSK